jgi:hypothetical protein
LILLLTTRPALLRLNVLGLSTLKTSERSSLT